MTRQMADDEVLRVLDAAIMRNGHRGDYPGELAMQREARSAVAALQAEQDAALREISCCDDVNLGVPLAQSISELQQHRERAEAERDALRGKLAGETARAAALEALAEQSAAKHNEACEWAERDRAALEALRGQVAGLVEGLRTELAAGGEDSNHYTTYELGRINEKRRCAYQLAELLTIKERMG